MSANAQAQARQTIALHSKSFALASKLLPPAVAVDAVVLYAWCRHVDDHIDLAAPEQYDARMADLRREIDDVYAPTPCPDSMLRELQRVVAERKVPRIYLEELVAGMAMDAEQRVYRTWDDLLLYCYRVAGTVGLMMCHVMGVRRPEALAHAAHLGMAMQLTNICRDVLEDWNRQRLYLPDELLAQCGAPNLRSRLEGEFPVEARRAVAVATEHLLERADNYYRSGDAGIADLSLRCGFAVRTARLVYARIGHQVRAQKCDPLAGRAVVAKSEKLKLVARSAMRTLASALRARRVVPRVPTVCLGDVSQVPLP